MYQRCDGIAWEGAPDICSWIPSCGKWRNGHDPPSKIVLLDISTNAAPPLEAYEFWHETAGTRAFFSKEEIVSRGHVSHHAGVNGHEGFDLGLVISGERKHRSKNDETRLTHSCGFFLYNAARPLRVKGGAGSGVHLLLRREVVEIALGPMPPVSAIAHALTCSRLTPVLKNQMLLLARIMGDLTQAESDFLLDQTARLALFAIKERAVSDTRPIHSVRAALFTDAQRYIERHFAYFDLDVNRIASDMGASRATLYRAFADRGLTVADAIREMRLARAQDMLKAGPLQISVDSIAEACGFAHTRSFQRAFRVRFGMNPSELRPRHR